MERKSKHGSLYHIGWGSIGIIWGGVGLFWYGLPGLARSIVADDLLATAIATFIVIGTAAILLTGAISFLKGLALRTIRT
jgi:hypothetical protein